MNGYFDQFTELVKHIGAWWLVIIAVLGYLKRFMDNLAANIPSLKGDTTFLVFAGILNAIIETAQGKNRAAQPDKETQPGN